MGDNRPRLVLVLPPESAEHRPSRVRCRGLAPPVGATVRWHGMSWSDGGGTCTELRGRVAGVEWFLDDSRVPRDAEMVCEVTVEAEDDDA